MSKRQVLLEYLIVRYIKDMLYIKVPLIKELEYQLN